MNSFINTTHNIAQHGLVLCGSVPLLPQGRAPHADLRKRFSEITEDQDCRRPGILSKRKSVKSIDKGRE
ncbi:MAG: hypothetical protein Q3M24_14355 [Candidatus Electrothrix aestuarii]|uniref:Uncharacterized protein n=1 Tax=Candidatus Electrothrix aestuarii TaxID=3062594 RepID=A0AAU8LQC2_9BACT|nr:hypothetical protein [Candidatus Electrothrix aestuarii]